MSDTRIERVADAFAPPTSRAANRPRAWAGAVVAISAIVVFFLGNRRVGMRCGQECFGEAPRSDYGSLTYEPGHAWTRYAGSWQWGAQNGLAVLALLAGLVGWSLGAFSERNPIRLYFVALVAGAAWVVWVLLSPPTG
jgi:hypothetical protein